MSSNGCRKITYHLCIKHSNRSMARYHCLILSVCKCRKHVREDADGGARERYPCQIYQERFMISARRSQDLDLFRRDVQSAGPAVILMPRLRPPWTLTMFRKSFLVMSTVQIAAPLSYIVLRLVHLVQGDRTYMQRPTVEITVAAAAPRKVKRLGIAPSIRATKAAHAPT